MNILRLPILVATVAFAFAAAAADPASIIKQRARDVANQPRPQPPPRPAPAQPVQPMTPVVLPAQPSVSNTTSSAALTVEQEAAIKKLLGDLNAIKPGSRPSATQTSKVQASLTALADAEIRPRADEVSKLAGQLSSAWGTQKMTSAEQSRFAKELRRVLNSASLPMADAQSAVSGAKTLLKYSGMNEDASGQIVETLTTIAAMAKP